MIGEPPGPKVRVPGDVLDQSGEVADVGFPAGKLPADLLARILGRLGDPPPEVWLGPAVGEDACAVRVPSGVLVAATDPITFTSVEVGRLAVVVNANDVAVMGVRPRWFMACVLLPVGVGVTEVEALFASMRDALATVGATLVGGHTEVTAVVTQPVVVGQMLGISESGRFVATAGARPGDAVVQVGPVPVEAAAVLAAEHHGRLAGVDSSVLLAAAAAFDDPGISVVEAALAAAELGATALHDPTEGGLAAGLHELAVRAEVAVIVARERILWYSPGVAVCAALGADPWATLASGALIATFPAHHVNRAVADLTARGYSAASIGVVAGGRGVRDHDGVAVPNPPRDEVARLRAG
jgi:hydrogenase maturation factor